MYDSRYSSTSRLYEKAWAQLGMTSNTYRKGGQNVEITYAVIDWSLGQILVAATDKGVCAVRLGDDAATLESNLKEYTPTPAWNGTTGSSMIG